MPAAVGFGGVGIAAGGGAAGVGAAGVAGAGGAVGGLVVVQLKTSCGCRTGLEGGWLIHVNRDLMGKKWEIAWDIDGRQRTSAKRLGMLQRNLTYW